jgi:hypothetical protein
MYVGVLYSVYCLLYWYKSTNTDRAAFPGMWVCRAIAPV